MTALQVLNSILTTLGKIADLVESSRDRDSRVTIDRQQRKDLCEAIVRNANKFTDRFNTAATTAEADGEGIQPYTDEASKTFCLLMYSIC
jgi:hypothetical protein